MGMNVTYQDLGLIIVFAVIVIVGVFLVRALKRLGDALGKLNGIMDGSAEHIGKAAKSLPKLAENAVILTDEACDILEAFRQEQDMVDDALASIGETVEQITDTVQGINGDLFSGVKKVAGLLAALYRLIAKKAPAGAAPGAKEAEAEAAGDAPGPEAADTGAARGSASKARRARKADRRRKRIKKSATRTARAEHIDIRIKS